ncbi:MAG TPA: flagellar hook-basal body complex protein FliE [Fimbriimonas sp.]|nr:flagellar hook-basal body complex protein FliE [Fimbriimonas sp.]
MLTPTNPAIQQAFGIEPISVPKLSSAGVEKGGDFAQTLMDVVKEVNNAQTNSTQMQDDFISGRRPVEYHDLMISMEKASTSMQLTMAVRNKMLEAYQEIDRMQV